jgi:hypothetical protein
MQIDIHGVASGKYFQLHVFAALAEQRVALGVGRLRLCGQIGKYRQRD